MAQVARLLCFYFMRAHAKKDSQLMFVAVDERAMNVLIKMMHFVIELASRA